MAEITLGGVTLPEDMQWTNEFTGWKRGQNVQTGVHGSLIVQEAARSSGRPITLTTGADNGGAVPYATVLAVQALIDAGGTLALSIPRQGDVLSNFSVRFDHANPIEARPLAFMVPPADSDWYFLRISLFTV